jgi:hypothetical protein
MDSPREICVLDLTMFQAQVGVLYEMSVTQPYTAFRWVLGSTEAVLT